MLYGMIVGAIIFCTGAFVGIVLESCGEIRQERRNRENERNGY